MSGTALLRAALAGLAAGLLVAQGSFGAAAPASAARADPFANPPRRVLHVGPGAPYERIADAAAAARTGDIVEVEAGDYPDDVAVWTQNDLVIRAVHGRARVTQEGRAAQDKAIFVVQGDNVVVQGFELRGARSTGRNGAGLRHEGGRLTVRDCVFADNEMGLLTWNDARAELVVERSDFGGNRVAPTHAYGEPIGHQVYVGLIRRFEVRDSYVHDGAFGHLIKSRARENFIVNNRIDDGIAGRASYEIDLPSGGIAYVVGNVVVQSAQTDNAVMLSFGEEGYRWADNELYAAHNTFVDHLGPMARFARVSAGAGRVEFVDNLLVGGGTLDLGETARRAGNARAARGDVASIEAGDYRLRRGSRLAWSAVPAGAAHGVSLAPQREYVHALASRALRGRPRHPGALQDLAP